MLELMQWLLNDFSETSIELLLILLTSELLSSLKPRLCEIPVVGLRRGIDPSEGIPERDQGADRIGAVESELGQQRGSGKRFKGAVHAGGACGRSRTTTA